MSRYYRAYRKVAWFAGLRVSEKLDSVKLLNPFPGSTVQNLVYHGTDADFSHFEPQSGARSNDIMEWESSSQGFFFTDSPDAARGFGKNLIAAYIDLKNPLATQHDTGYFEDENRFEDARWIFLPLIDNGVIDLGAFAVHVDDVDNGDWPDEMTDAEHGGLDWNVLDDRRVPPRMRARGYDGSVVGEGDTNMPYSYFVMDESQIRWAIP